MAPLLCAVGEAKSSPVRHFPQPARPMRTEFVATGFQVPERLVTNQDLAGMMDTSDEWIVQRSGIRTRYWVSPGETGVSLAAAAATRALAKAGLTAREDRKSTRLNSSH